MISEHFIGASPTELYLGLFKVEKVSGLDLLCLIRSIRPLSELKFIALVDLHISYELPVAQ